MKATQIKKIAILVAITTMVGMAYAKKENIQHLLRKEVSANDNHDNRDYEEMLLLNNLFADAAGDYHLTATMRVTDFSDRSRALQNSPYIIQKSADALYMRAGSSESLNTVIGCVSVSHDTRDILLSPAREVVLPETFTAKQLRNMLDNEKYQFTKAVTGDTIRYSLTNEGHAVCKAYSIAVSASGKKIVQVNTRYADPAEPENLSGQKEIIIYISDYGKGVTNAALLDLTRIIDTAGAHVKAAEQYKDFSIIQ
jgi:hypothetical protein